jgi:hypothetical protein
MNKDALLATLIGFGIGLFITGMLLVGPKLLQYLPKISLNLPKMTSQQKPKPSTNPKPKEFAITVDSPLDESLESEKEVLVSGTTMEGTTVIIQGNNNDSASLVNADGKFAGKITLTEGKNEITVIGVLKDKRVSKTITVFYTPEEL